MCDNARPQTHVSGQEKQSAHLRRQILPHPSYSPDLVPSDNHLFDSTKEGLRVKHFAGDKEVKTAVMKSFKEQSTEFYEADIHALTRKWNIAIERNHDYVEKLGYDPQRTSCILMYDTRSCFGNYSYTKEKGITRIFVFLLYNPTITHHWYSCRRWLRYKLLLCSFIALFVYLFI